MENRSKGWLTYTNYFMTVLFLVIAGLQFNDPDSLQWILIYGMAALVCLLWERQFISRFWYYLLSGIGLIWLILLFVSADHLSFGSMFDEFKMTNQNVEVAREIGGLLIVSIWMGVLGFKSKSKSAPT